MGNAARVVIALLIPVAAYCTDSRLDSIRVEHDRVLSQMNVKGSDGKPMELDDPRIPPLLKEGWQLAGEWAAAWLEEHRGASTEALKHIFDGFAPERKGVKSQYGDFLEYNDYGFQGSAVRIAPGVYVVEGSYAVWFATGTFVVVARDRSGKLGARWNIKDLAEEHYPQRDEIGRWLHLVRRAYYNGPLTVSKLVVLAPAANGHPRFAVDAHQGADGGTALHQLSVWEWEGDQAKPLPVETYEVAGDFQRFQFDGTTFRISTKEPLTTLVSCGMCEEPRGVWTLRTIPAGVENLGHRFVHPELKWADQLLANIGDGRDTAKLCAPNVRDVIEAWTRKARADWGDDFSWGMFGDYRVIDRRGGGAIELQTDEERLHFRYVLRDGHPYFTSVNVE